MEWLAASVVMTNKDIVAFQVVPFGVQPALPVGDSQASSASVASPSPSTQRVLQHRPSDAVDFANVSSRQRVRELAAGYRKYGAEVTRYEFFGMLTNEVLKAPMTEEDDCTHTLSNQEYIFSILCSVLKIVFKTLPRDIDYILKNEAHFLNSSG